MRKSTRLAASLFLGAALMAPLAAHAAQPTTAADFNLFVLGDKNAAGSDVEGAVAVGGNAGFSGFSIGASLPPSQAGYANLVVGGNLTLGGGTVVGQTLVGGTYSGPGYFNVTANDHALPVNFAAESTRVNNLSDYYATLGQTAGATSARVGSTLTINALGAGQNIINLSAADLAAASRTNLNLGANSTVIINVDGSVDSFTGGLYLNGSQMSGGHIAGASNILWNFSDATSLSIHDIGMIGSVLAPDANFYGSGVIDGQLVVDNFYQYNNSTMQVNWAQAAPGLLSFSPRAVPEPATWAMMIGGFGLMGAALRRRRMLQSA